MARDRSYGGGKGRRPDAGITHLSGTDYGDAGIRRFHHRRHSPGDAGARALQPVQRRGTRQAAAEHARAGALPARTAPDGARVALVACEPRSGRQHQIRAHLFHHGTPILGDKIYGPDELIFDRFTRHAMTADDHAALARIQAAFRAAVSRV